MKLIITLFAAIGAIAIFYLIFALISWNIMWISEDSPVYWLLRLIFGILVIIGLTRLINDY